MNSYEVYLPFFLGILDELKEIGHDPASSSDSSKHLTVEQPKRRASVRQSKYNRPRNHRVLTAKEAILEEFPAGIWCLTERDIFEKVCEYHDKRGIRKPSWATIERALEMLREDEDES
jgi:hypothetical protein